MSKDWKCWILPIVSKNPNRKLNKLLIRNKWKEAKNTLFNLEVQTLQSDCQTIHLYTNQEKKKSFYVYVGNQTEEEIENFLGKVDVDFNQDQDQNHDVWNKLSLDSFNHLFDVILNPISRIQKSIPTNQKIYFGFEQLESIS